MKRSISDALVDLAGEARMYADIDALVEPRRRHIRRLAALSAAAGAVAAATAGVLGYALLTASPDRGPQPPFTAAASQQPAPPTAAPRRVQVPSSPSALPVNGAVGAGALVYAGCETTCQPLLLTRDGAQFRLPRTMDGPPTRAQTLSPDGRWLGQREPGRYVVRELSGPARHVVGGVWDAWTWSPDGRWLLLADHHDGDVRTYLRLDVRSGQETRLPPPEGGPVYAVLPTGELLVGPALQADSLTSKPITYQVVDPVRRTVLRALTVDVRPALRAGEMVAPDGIRVSPDGASVLVTVPESVNLYEARRVGIY